MPSGRCLSHPRLQHTTHKHFVYEVWVDACFFKGSFDGDGAQLGGWNARKCAIETPHGGSGGRYDEYFFCHKLERCKDTGLRIIDANCPLVNDVWAIMV